MKPVVIIAIAVVCLVSLGLSNNVSAQNEVIVNMPQVFVSSGSDHCSIALSTDKEKYSLSETVTISVWTWPDNCDQGQDQDVKVTIFGNDGKYVERIIVGNNPSEFKYTIGSEDVQGQYKIYANGVGTVGTEIYFDVGEFDSKQKISESEPQTKIKDGIGLTYTGKDPTGSDLWVESEESYNQRVIYPLIFQVIAVIAIIIIIVIVIYKVVKNRKKF